MLTSQTSNCPTCAVYAQQTALLKNAARRGKGQGMSVEAAECLMRLQQRQRGCKRNCDFDHALHAQAAHLIDDYLLLPDQRIIAALTYALTPDPRLQQLGLSPAALTTTLNELGLSALRQPTTPEFPAALERYLGLLLERGLAHQFNDTLSTLQTALGKV